MTIVRRSRGNGEQEEGGRVDRRVRSLGTESRIKTDWVEVEEVKNADRSKD